MSPLPPRDELRVISEWSIDTLYVHLSRIVEDLDKRTSLDVNGKFQLLNTALLAIEKSAAAALAASEKAVSKAEISSERRFESTNEWRSTVQDLIKDTISRKEVDQRIEMVNKETAGIASRLDRIEAGRLGLQAGWGILISVITVAGLVIFGVVMALKK